MKPPFSVIFLTTLIGMGQGLFLALYSEQIYLSLTQGEMEPFNFFFLVSTCIALCLTGLGLIASFFHLGHPERAWRSAACWKTSWLSREVIALPLFILFVFIYSLNFFPGFTTHILKVDSITINLSIVTGFLCSILCIVLFVCTSMIYACLRFLQEWNSLFTMINFMLMGCASGFILAATISSFMAPLLTLNYVVIAIVLTILAATSRSLSLARNKKLRPKSTIQSALGINNPKIVQKSQGAMGGSFNTRIFFHGKSRLFFKSIKWIFLTLAFLIPIIMLLMELENNRPFILLFALLIQYIGLIAERWYFFAEAKHPQNLYYQAIS